MVFSVTKTLAWNTCANSTSCAMSATELLALWRAPNPGPPIYTASAPCRIASLAMLTSRAGLNNSRWCCFNMGVTGAGAEKRRKEIETGRKLRGKTPERSASGQAVNRFDHRIHGNAEFFIQQRRRGGFTEGVH